MTVTTQRVQDYNDLYRGHANMKFRNNKGEPRKKGWIVSWRNGQSCQYFPSYSKARKFANIVLNGFNS